MPENLKRAGDATSKPSNPFGKIMPVQLCERTLARLFSLLAVRPKPDAVELSGLEEIECSELEYCLIEHVARLLQLLLPEIYRKLGKLPERYRKPGRTEQAAFDRYKPLRDRCLPDRWLRIRIELDEELRQQYPRRLRLCCDLNSAFNPGDLFFNCVGDYLNLNSIVPARPIFHGAFLDLKQCFPESDLYCAHSPKPIVISNRTRKKYVIRAKAGWETFIEDIVLNFLAKIHKQPLSAAVKSLKSPKRAGQRDSKDTPQNEPDSLRKPHENGSPEAKFAEALKRYKSPVKRAVAVLLQKSPDLTAREICDGLDELPDVELEETWKRNPNDRLFRDAYRGEHRSKIDALISKVRKDLRSQT